jgi:hypothetical protein
LELGIVVHSIIIGISLGASGSPETIKPLMAALSFHQFFEGLGLGGCITQVYIAHDLARNMIFSCFAIIAFCQPVEFYADYKGWRCRHNDNIFVFSLFYYINLLYMVNSLCDLGSSM